MDEKKTQTQIKQEKYVEARVAGATQDKAAEIAGYSRTTDRSQIERIGGPVHTLMVKALAEKGITEGWIAEKYRDGIEAAQQVGAKEKDLNAMSQMLKQIGYLMGYAKNGPAVAVQINNNPQNGAADDAAPTREDIEYLKGLIENLAEQVSADRASGLLPNDTGTPDPEAHIRMGESIEIKGPPCGGGQP